MSSKLTAILLLVAGVTLFGIMDGLGKFLGADYSVVQIVWARYAFAAPVILVAAGPAVWSGMRRSGRPVAQVIRGLMQLVTSSSVIVGLALMPLADFTAISFAAPLIVVVLSMPVLREAVPARSWIGVLVGFIGVLIIARPGAGAIAWAAVYPLITALSFALYQLFSRLLRDDPPLVTMAWMIAVGLVLTTATLPFAWHPVAAGDWPLLVLTGILFGVAHYLVTRAFTLAPAPLLAPFSYAQIVAAVIFGLIVFGDIPDVWTTCGTILIIAAGIYVLERRTV